MQQINTERQHINGRLARQLPANLLEQTTSHVKKNTITSQNHFKQITGVNQTKSPLQNPRTDQRDFDTYRSLSTCPTYSSLSRHSHDTRDCATQITTLPRTEPIENISTDLPLLIDNNPAVHTDEIVLMPISSGFNDYPYYYPNRIGKDVDTQFRDTQREKYHNGPKSQIKNKPNGKLPPPRPTPAKQSPRADTFILPKKQQTVNPQISKTKSASDAPRRMPPLPPPRGPPPKESTPPPQRKRLEPIHQNGSSRPTPKFSNLPADQEDFGRKPIRFASQRNPKNRSSSPPPPPPPPATPPPPPPPVHYRKPASLPNNVSDRSRLVHAADHDYIIQERRDPIEYVYDDYYADAPVERHRSVRRVRVVRDVDYSDDDQDYVYYVKSAHPRRAPRRIYRPPSTEYVYSERIPTRIRPHDSDIVYVDEHDRPIENYHNEYIYVDRNGNEVEEVEERGQSPEYVEYIYENERDQRRVRQPKVIYVDDERPIRNRIRTRQPSSTRIVYE